MSKKALDAVRGLLSRRRALQGTAALVSTTALGCGDAAPEGSADGSSSDGGTSGGTSGSSGVDESSSSTTSGSSSSTSSDGTTTGGTDGSGDTTGGGVELTPEELLAPIEHIIVLCMENRSFDHYYGALQLVEGNGEVDGLDGTETNPDQNGEDVAVFEMNNFEPADPPHGWDACHGQWNNGANDGFVLEHFESNGDAVKHEVMGYHVREHLPVHYALADAYCVCDRWFCSLLSQTWPNRYYLHCASSSGSTNNTPASPGPTTIQEACDDAGISNRNYYDGVAAWKWGAYPISGFSGTSGIGEFFDKLQNGGLEQVVILDPDFLSNDDHPSHNIQLGQALISTIYHALAQSQYWEKSLLIITYDEHGGFFDHVNPPTTVDDEGPEFAQMGFRVPTVVVGPHVRKGAINHTVLEHSSFPATVALRFGFPQLNARAAAAADVSSCIDPAFVDDPQPPAPVPQLIIDEQDVLAHAGLTTSQPELFESLGIEVPLQGEHLERHREKLRAFLAQARRVGAIKTI